MLKAERLTCKKGNVNGAEENADFEAKQKIISKTAQLWSQNVRLGLIKNTSTHTLWFRYGFVHKQRRYTSGSIFVLHAPGLSELEGIGFFNSLK